MTESPAAVRPPQVTVAGWVAVVGSVLLVFSMFDRIGQLRTLDSQEYWSSVLEDPPWSAWGLDLQQLLGLLHVVYVVTGGCAAAAAFLAYFALQRSRAARVGLSVVAVPLGFAVLFQVGLTAALVAVSAMLMWSAPARDWFAGRPVRQPFVARPPASSAGTPQLGAPTYPPAVSRQPIPGELPPPAWPAGPPVGAIGPSAAARPTPVVVACLVTWLTSMLVAGLFVLAVAGLYVDPAAFREALEREPRFETAGVTFEELRTVTAVIGGLFVVWAIAASALALLVLLRVRWALPLLVASAITCSVVSLVVAPFVMLTSVVPAAAGAAVAYLLLRPEVRFWLSRR